MLPKNLILACSYSSRCENVNNNTIMRYNLMFSYSGL